MKVLADMSSVGSIMDSDGRASEVTVCAMVETDSLAGSLTSASLSMTSLLSGARKL